MGQYLGNYWTVIWYNFIFPTFESIYQAMNSIIICSFVSGSIRVSLWDFCIAVIVMGAIINLFINFTMPTIPDRAIKSKRNKKE